MTIKNIVFLSSIMAMSSLHMTAAPAATAKAKAAAPTSLAHSQSTFKAFFKKFLMEQAQAKNMSTTKFIATKTKPTGPVVVKPAKITIKAAAAKAAVVAKQKAKTTKATAKVATSVQK